MAKRERVIELNQSWAGPYAALWNRPASEPFTPDPNADLYAVIPWAKDAGLELIEVQNNTWLYVAGDLFYAPRHISKWQKIGVPRNELYGFYPTRESALKSPPPMPPGYVAANSLLDELAEVAYEADKIEGSGPWSTLSDKGRESWRKKALAVARRLLEREPGDKEVNDAVEEWQKEARTLDDYCRVIIKASRRAQLAELDGEVPT